MITHTHQRPPKLEDFFRKEPLYNPRQDRLLDIRPSHRWFGELQACAEADTYIFQKEFDQKSGPTSVVEGRDLQIVSSYDYQGLIGHPYIEAAAIEAIRKFGTGTGGVRLLTGTNALHNQLEYTLSQWTGKPMAMTFSSGYLANLTAIAGLFDARDYILADEYIHRSLIDAFRLAGVPFKTFRHNDPASLAQLLQDHTVKGRRTLIVVEGIYSMDGDICVLDEIVKLKTSYGAFLLLDEAHSFGVLGKTGKGAVEYYGIDPAEVDIITGSLSKTIPSNGGFLAAREEIIHFLKHGGAPFMFSAALSPANVAAAQASLEVMKKESWRLEKLWQNTTFFLQGVKRLPVNIGQSHTPVVPLICGDNPSTFALSRKLYDKGYLATAVIYPAVPAKMARLRLCMTAAMNEEGIKRFLQDLTISLNEC